MGYTEHLMSALGEEEVGGRTHSFFMEVLGRIGLTDKQIRAHSEVRVRELPIHGSEERDPLHLSNDRLTELWVGDRTVATILALRTAFNYEQILLADHLSPEMIAQLRTAIGADESNIPG